MARFVITNASVVLPDRVVARRAVEVSGGRIRRVVSMRALGKTSVKHVVDAGGRLLAPGFIDLHVHGTNDYLVNNGPGSLAALCAMLSCYGVTGFLPTVTPLPHAELVELVRQLSSLDTPPGAAILGMHLEGPYLALQGALPDTISTQPNRREVEALIDACAPHRAVFSIAPELEGVLDVIPVMVESGAPVFMTHTMATVDETRAAIEAGARHATHFYDVWPCPPETERGKRPTGAVEAVLVDDRVSVDFILDGVHVDPIAVHLALRCKGADRVCLVTDAMIGAGLPPGRYRFGKEEVVFETVGGPARLAEGSPRAGGLAGSGLTMDHAVRNAVEMLGIEVPIAVCMASTAPAGVLGLGGCKGQVAEGFDADLVLLDEALNVTRTWVGGECVYSSDDET